jgi:bifunctional non-homologous end joining protein LigD
VIRVGPRPASGRVSSAGMESLEPLPRFVAPMLARSGPLPEGAGWAFEVKFDGIRAQLRWDRRSLCLRSRPGRDCTDAFPELASLADSLGRRRLLLDGELVCLDADGQPDFTSLRARLRSHGGPARTAAARSPATLLAFDLLHLDGRSTRTLPYAERRARLAELQLDGPLLRAPRDFRDDAPALLDATREQGLEGVVAKRLDAPYEPGRRSAAWVKHKHHRRETFIVTGWAPAAGRRQPDSILLARRLSDGRLEPAGSVGFGPCETRERLRALLPSLELPASARRRVRRVAGGLTATVEFHGPVRGPVRDPILRRVSAEDGAMSVAEPS